MIRKIKEWLLKPYPLFVKPKPKLIIAFGIGLFIFVFLSIFNPFDFETFTKQESLYYKVLYSSITIVVILVNVFIVQFLFSSFINKKSWKVYKEILIDLEIVIVITILNWILSDYSSFYDKDSYFDFRFFLMATISVGVIPLSFYIVVEERIFSKRQEQKKKEQKVKQNTIIDVGDVVTIKGDNKNEIIKIELQGLLYITSEKNYCSIFYLEDGKIKEKLLRSSLNKIERQLKPYNFVFRCHKSFIVNMNNIEKIIGNAHRYNFVLKNVSNILIPISRKFSKKELKKIVK